GEEQKLSVSSGLVKSDLEEEELQAQEEIRIKSLMTGMAAMDTEQGRLTASTVGQIVGLQSHEIKQMVSEYAEKQSELSAEERAEQMGPAQQQRRKVTALNKQLTQKSKILEQLKVKSSELQAERDEAKRKLSEVTRYSDQLDEETSALDKLESTADPG
ncbi:hypothetical protein GDO81_027106, partial [Engystomops pustulosus]